MKNLLPSSPSTTSLFPIETCSVRNRVVIREVMAVGRPEKSGTLRSESGDNVGSPFSNSTAIRSALLSSTLVRLTRYVPPSTCTHGSRLKSQRGVIDIIFGDVFVVFARLRATAVVTLRCRRLSDINTTFVIQRAVNHIPTASQLLDVKMQIRKSRPECVLI